MRSTGILEVDIDPKPVVAAPPGRSSFRFPKRIRRGATDNIFRKVEDRWFIESIELNFNRKLSTNMPALVLGQLPIPRPVLSREVHHSTASSQVVSDYGPIITLSIASRADSSNGQPIQPIPPVGPLRVSGITCRYEADHDKRKEKIADVASEWAAFMSVVGTAGCSGHSENKRACASEPRCKRGWNSDGESGTGYTLPKPLQHCRRGDSLRAGSAEGQRLRRVRRRGASRQPSRMAERPPASSSTRMSMKDTTAKCPSIRKGSGLCFPARGIPNTPTSTCKRWMAFRSHS